MENKVNFDSETTRPSFSQEELLNRILNKMEESDKLRKKQHDTSTQLAMKNKDELKRTSEKGFETIQNQNTELLKEISDLKQLNKEMKYELQRYTPDKLAKTLGISFFCFFALSIIFTVFMDYELVKFAWAKAGMVISLVIIVLGILVGNMFKVEFNGGKN